MIIALLAASFLMSEAPPPGAGSAGVPGPPPASAEDTARAPSGTVVSTKGLKLNKDGLICHNEQVLGTHFPKKVCFTPEQAADRQQQDRFMLEHMQAMSHQ